MLISANTSYLQAINVIIVIICVMYKITAELAHRFYHDATVVDYNLNLKFLVIGDAKNPSCTRLQKIENHRSLVIQNKCEQALHTCTVCLYHVISLFGHQLAIS